MSARKTKTNRRQSSTKRAPVTEKLTTEQSEKLYADFAASPAVLTIEQMERIESNFTDREEGIPRRLALSILTKSGPEILELAKERRGAEVLARAYVATMCYTKRLRQYIEALEMTEARCAMALCSRGDMWDLIEAAEKEMEETPAAG